MLSVTELRNGTIYKDSGAPYTVLKYTHTKVGRGNATIRVKVRNLITGATLERAFTSGASVEEADVQKVKAQYLYRAGERVYFMEMVGFEQIELPVDLIDEGVSYLKDGQEVFIFIFEGRAVSVELPITVQLKVTETEPGFKGDTATAALKPATVETGLKVDVPLFIRAGDTIKIDTRTGEYLERV